MFLLNISRYCQLILISITTVIITGALAVAQCPPLYSFTGKAFNGFLGSSVSGAGDVDGDGYADLIVGVERDEAGWSRAGRALVFSGRTGDTLYVFTGESADDHFGASVASAGDVNNDGFSDLIIGAEHNDAGGLNSGKAYVYSGQSGALIYTFAGEAAGDLFGHSVASAGDVNNDGYADLIVGAHWNDAGAFRAGRAYVFSGLDGDTLHVFTGVAAGDEFGFSVASAGDVNNDGISDLVIGARRNDAGGPNSGRAYVFSGLNGDTLYVFTGEAAFDGFGNSIAPAGDVNNDGFDDIIAGAPNNDAGAFNAGRAYVFSGQNGDTLHVFTGAAAGDEFGFSVASAGDVNSDGISDLVIGARFNDAGGPNSGRAYVFSGLNGDTLYVFTGDAADDGFGISVASAGDIDYDGYSDVIVGAPFNDFGDAGAGRAYVYLGKPCGAVIRVPADQPTIQAGIDFANPGDTVLVADGTYTGNGNRDIDFGGKNVVLKSENGPIVTIIDSQGSFSDPHRGFNFRSGEDKNSVVDGFTIRGGSDSFGFSTSPPVGGGIRCVSSSSPIIINNIISDNFLDGLSGGGGIFCSQSSPLISANTISGNTAEFGGGIFCQSNSNPIIRDNIIANNSAELGGGIFFFRNSSSMMINNSIIENSATSRGAALYLADSSLPSVESCIFAFNSGGEVIRCEDANTVPTLTCCDVYGNTGGDWTGCIASQANISNNFSLNPFFCDTANNDFHLSWGSPCLPRYSSCGALVGGLDLGCKGMFVCADANGDSLVTQEDIAFLQSYYSQCSTEPFPLGASDVNCDNIVDIQDIIYLASYLNANGPAPCCAQ